MTEFRKDAIQVRDAFHANIKIACFVVRSNLKKAKSLLPVKYQSKPEIRRGINVIWIA